MVNHSKEELDKQRIWLVKLCSDKPKWVKELADFVHSNRPLVAKGQTFCVEVIEEALEIANAIVPPEYRCFPTAGPSHAGVA